MFKRCHSLKKSHINLKSHAKTILPRPRAHISDPDKQNIMDQHNCVYGVVSKVEMIKSVEWSGSKTVRARSGLGSGAAGGPAGGGLGKVKNLCKQIEEIQGKITAYRELLQRKEQRHAREKQARIQQKQQQLSALIRQYQQQKQRTSHLKSQMVGLGMWESLDWSCKQPELTRRTTATFPALEP